MHPTSSPATRLPPSAQRGPPQEAVEPPAATRIWPPAPPEAPVGPTPWERAAAALHVRGVEPLALAIFGATFAGVAAFVFLLEHPGLGAALGFVALAAGELSLVRPGFLSRESVSRSEALRPLIDLLLAAALVGALAPHHPPIVLALAVTSLVLVAWLSHLDATGGAPSAAGSPVGRGLWRRADRMAILLLGALLGRPGPALLLLTLVGSIDVWLRLQRIDPPAGVPPRIPPGPWRRILAPDASLLPAARWTSLALVLALLLLLPASRHWRF